MLCRLSFIKQIISEKSVNKTLREIPQFARDYCFHLMFINSENRLKSFFNSQHYKTHCMYFIYHIILYTEIFIDYHVSHTFKYY